MLSVRYPLCNEQQRLRREGRTSRLICVVLVVLLCTMALGSIRWFIRCRAEREMSDTLEP